MYPYGGGFGGPCCPSPYPGYGFGYGGGWLYGLLVIVFILLLICGGFWFKNSCCR